MNELYTWWVFLGYQSESQLQAIYGPSVATSIKTNVGNKFIFRSPDVQDAKELSDLLGRKEITRKSGSTSFGLNSLSDRESISDSEVTKNIILDSEIRDLHDGHFFLKSLNIDPVKDRVLKRIFPKIHKDNFFESPAIEKNCENEEKPQTEFQIVWFPALKKLIS